MGNGNVKLVRLQYNEIEPMQRAASSCTSTTTSSSSPLRRAEIQPQPEPRRHARLAGEGTATAVQYLVIHNLQDDPGQDHLFGKGTGPSDPTGRVKETINEFGAAVFGAANEQYAGVSRNYRRRRRRSPREDDVPGARLQDVPHAR